MRLLTPYAPPTFLKPVIVIDTLFDDREKETAIMFIEALNQNHALSYIYAGKEDVKKSDWIVIQKHKTQKQAIDFHLKLAKQMEHGENHNKGYKPYLKLYDMWCPSKMK